MSIVKAKKPPKIDKNKKYTFDEMLQEAEKIADRKAEAKASQMFREMCKDLSLSAVEASMQLACIVLNDSFGFGGKRLATFHDELDKYAVDLADKKITIDDVHEIYEVLWAKVEKQIKKEGVTAD